MSDKPAISVVIPLYNKGPCIARALNSVLAQTFQDFEVIVVDDGSTDNGADVVKGFHHTRIRLIQQNNKGVSSARNFGVNATEAEMIAFLDADDEWFPSHLETIMRLRMKYPEAGIYSTHYKQFFSDNKITKPKFYGILFEPWEGVLSDYFKSCTYGDTPVCSSTAGIPKSIFIMFEGFQKGYWWGEDTDLWGRIAFEHPVVFSWDGGVILYRNAENRACNKKQPVINHPFVLSATKYIKSCINNETDICYIKEYLAKEKMSQALFNYEAGYNKEARKILNECETEKFKLKKEIYKFLYLLPLPIYLSLARCKNYLILKQDH